MVNGSTISCDLTVSLGSTGAEGDVGIAQYVPGTGGVSFANIGYCYGDAICSRFNPTNLVTDQAVCGILFSEEALPLIPARLRTCLFWALSSRT